MRNIMIATAVAALCAASVPAVAQEADQDNAQASQPSQPRARNGERRVCVNERVSESRMTRRICRTAREWREMNDTDFGN